MRLPNGYGGIARLPGTRRNPFRVRITTGWELVDGKQKQIYSTLGYYPTRKAAMLALAEYNKDPYDLANKKITFEQCYNEWSPKHYEKYTSVAGGLKSTYKLCQPIKNMPIADIRLKHMQEIMDRISDKSVSVQTKLKTIFIKTFKFAMENDIVQKDYSQFVTIANTPAKHDIENKFFTKEEIEKVKQNLDWLSPFPIAKKKMQNINLTYSVLLLLYTGVRIGELLNIKLTDINIEERTIDLKGTKTAAAKRIVPIHQDILPIIKDKLATHKTYLVENNNGNKIQEGSYRFYFFQDFMKLIGAEHTPHATRHTFISVMDKCGVPAESVVLKRIVGHANSSVTEHYTHKEIDELIAAIDKFKI